MTCLCQKRIPDALATLVLHTDADVAVREKSLVLLQSWAASLGAKPKEAGHHVRILHDALDRLRLEGVPVDAVPGGKKNRDDAFAKWMAQHAARERSRQQADSARGVRASSRRAKAAAARADEAGDIMPVGKDGTKRGTTGDGAAATAEKAALLDGRPRWNVAGRRARRGPEGNDLYRTGTRSGARDSSDEGDSDEGDDAAERTTDAADTDADTRDGAKQSDSVWRTSRQQPRPGAAAGGSADARRGGGGSGGGGRARVTGLPQSISSDMADAAMMQEMLALNLRDEGESILEDGDLEGALAVFTQAMSYAPNYRLYVARAQVLLRMGRAREAHSDAQQLVTLLPSFHTGHALLGQALEQQGRLAQAGASYEKAAFLAAADGDEVHAEEYEDAKDRCKHGEGVRENGGSGYAGGF